MVVVCGYHTKKLEDMQKPMVTPWANAPMGRADQVLVKTGAAHRFIVSEILTLPRPDEGAGCLTGHQIING